MGTILEKCGKSCQEEQRICKSCLIILLHFNEISLHCRNMDIIFINFEELLSWGGCDKRNLPTGLIEDCQS